jgi:hypothetical protein
MASRKRIKIKLNKIEGDVLPEIRKLLERMIKEKTKLWGKTRYAQTILQPKTNEDLLFLNLEALAENALRMQECVMKDFTKSDFFKVYINNFKEHIGRIIGVLEDMGFDMETPPQSL